MSRSEPTLGQQSESPTPTKSREFRCRDCRSRCTVGTDGKTEYGHRYGCPERPSNFPVGEGSGQYERVKQ